MLSDEPRNQLHTVLVANRGEIAVRVIRAARDAGLRSVAVHAEADRGALHTRLADEVRGLAGDGAAAYLDIDGVVGAAVTSGADAVHPGYGFLAENADFAQAVLDAGLVWVGPSPATIRDLGDKVTARRIARSVGAPLAPGTEEPVRDVAEIEDFAREHGLPLVIKAAFGGGGRGLKVVHDAASIPELFESATREATAAFGRGECFVERFLARARHVEAQVLADGYGTVVVLGTRDCSLQRRNQKLVEEAPAPNLAPEQRRVIHESAKEICRAVGYSGAGTVEYLVGEDGLISFLEVNTRLQVEHPVTEETTGIDVVAEQFRIAAGAKLLADTDPEPRGHAFEFRLTSEDAGRGFVPAAGTVTTFAMPSGPGIRVDAGIEAGDRVDGRFDSMFAKLVVSGADRAEALHRARRALAEVRVAGVPTPLPLYRQVVEHPDFAGDRFAVHNRWIETDFDGEIEPWSGAAVSDELTVRVGRQVLSLRVPGLAHLGERGDSIRREAAALRGDAATVVSGNAVAAPMQGTIVRVAVADGQQVAAGDVVAVLEAMKMENHVVAHHAGIVTGLAVAVGDTVAQGTVLCELT
ncbi:acetyl/propionyl/methylcrotonyl-CoA carboxylase subunit alpha [Pseudonocardia sp. TRM90224]|uniref:acetyl/propionyl/methylcrotonyl-CoA carboxylase subunit alpha n=1 Tax=Pseudonocardia sp. TRM90224 TaxID=2812678 RepID=UPI001E4F6F53|nr:biotin carboxylase N-terminal domain-containing protein [Pseudonocardia sp. TRM90224]